MNPEDKLINVLNEFGYPVKRQGSLEEHEPYPEYFFTFWQLPTTGKGYYDDSATMLVSDFNVFFYGVDPGVVYDTLKNARKKLAKNGFTITDFGHDVDSDEPSHIGRGINALYLLYD